MGKIGMDNPKLAHGLKFVAHKRLIHSAEHVTHGDFIMVTAYPWLWQTRKGQTEAYIIRLGPSVKGRGNPVA